MHMSIWNTYGKGVGVSALVGVILSSIIAYSIGNRFVSTGAFVIENPDSATLQRAALEMVGRDYLIGVIKQEGLYRRELQRYPIEDVAADMARHDLRVESSGQTLRISFETYDRRGAMAGVGRLMGDFVRRPRETNQQVRVLDSPMYPEVPVYPHRLLILLIGLTVGSAAGFALVKFRRRQRVLSVILPPSSLQFVQAEASRGGFPSAEEYLRQLIEQQQQNAKSN